MPRKGLTKEAVIDASIQLIQQQGNGAFSLNELARVLDIRPASLYNHIESVQELTAALGCRIADMIKQAELEAIAGKKGQDALFALCDAYRSFARRHIGLYKVLMGMQKDKSACTPEAFREMTMPIMQVLSDYEITPHDRMHWQRILRAMMHGFITHEFAGGFLSFSVDSDETYRMAVRAMETGLRAAEEACRK